MTKREFVALPPIEMTILGRTVFMPARWKPGGLCVYESDRLEFFVPTPTGAIRCKGTFRLTPERGIHWVNQ